MFFLFSCFSLAVCFRLVYLCQSTLMTSGYQGDSICDYSIECEMDGYEMDCESLSCEDERSCSATGPEWDSKSGHAPMAGHILKHPTFPRSKQVTPGGWQVVYGTHTHTRTHAHTHAQLEFDHRLGRLPITEVLFWDPQHFDNPCASNQLFTQRSCPSFRMHVREEVPNALSVVLYYSKA